MPFVERPIRRRVLPRTMSIRGTWTRIRCARRWKVIWARAATITVTSNWTRCSQKFEKCCGPKTRMELACWPWSRNNSLTIRGCCCGRITAPRWRRNADSCGINWAPCGSASCSIREPQTRSANTGKPCWRSGQKVMYVRKRIPILGHPEGMTET